MASESKNKSSCLGLFIRAFMVIALVLANLSVLGIIIAVQFFEADYAAWTDFSHYTTRPSMLIGGILASAICGGVILSTVGAAVSLVFGNNSTGKSNSSSKPAPKARPQSNRRTTV
ncbi:MAG: hypothetical protein WC314_21305 [Vulcanimicrobiota bacterium]